jgi:hypothetical protein
MSRNGACHAGAVPAGHIRRSIRWLLALTCDFAISRIRARCCSSPHSRAAPDGDGCVLRLASDVLPGSGLTPIQQKALETLRDTFGADGATKSEWQRACEDIPERSFHRAAKILGERGRVQQVGTHWQATA